MLVYLAYDWTQLFPKRRSPYQDWFTVWCYDIPLDRNWVWTKGYCSDYLTSSFDRITVKRFQSCIWRKHFFAIHRLQTQVTNFELIITVSFWILCCWICCGYSEKIDIVYFVFNIFHVIIWCLSNFIYLFNFCCAFTEFTKVPNTMAFVAFGVSCWAVWFLFPYLSIDVISTVVAHSVFVLLDSISIILFVLLILHWFKWIYSILYLSSPFISAPLLAALSIFMPSFHSVSESQDLFNASWRI